MKIIDTIENIVSKTLHGERNMNPLNKIEAKVLAGRLIEDYMSMELKHDAAGDDINRWLRSDPYTYDGHAKIRLFMLLFEKYLDKNRIEKNDFFKQQYFELVARVTPDGHFIPIPDKVNNQPSDNQNNNCDKIDLNDPAIRKPLVMREYGLTNEDEEKIGKENLDKLFADIHKLTSTFNIRNCTSIIWYEDYLESVKVFMSTKEYMNFLPKKGKLAFQSHIQCISKHIISKLLNFTK